MKKIVNGKMYNTETAEHLHDWDNGYRRGDFNHCEESLYKTKKGNYFLAGSGGAMSKYSVACGSNTWSGSSDINPISEKEAIQWLEDHDGTTVLEARFSDKIEEA